MVHDELDEDEELEALEKVFDIDPMDLTPAFCQLPADLAYWGARYADAHRQAAAAKADEKQIHGANWEVARDRVTAIRGKATLDDIKAAIEQIDDVRRARENTIEAEYEKVRLLGIVDAIRSKRDMLISVGAHVRAEMDHDPSIKSRNRSSGPSAEGLEWGGKSE
jgi:hypothetical protein